MATLTAVVTASLCDALKEATAARGTPVGNIVSTGCERVSEVGWSPRVSNFYCRGTG
ncbi:hypothetical protein [Acidicapsa ligni]|uniref:hypothetical protein n=1 Tax=Acidicapsa ligni TaxID=542300 RepID=UPI0021DFAD2B|nr:hypothetical protein [Acidicapsa ligni]